MAHYLQELTGDFDDLVAHLDRATLQGSITAKYEDGADQRIGDAPIDHGQSPAFRGRCRCNLKVVAHRADDSR
jgi:hypothetical protein